MTLRHAPIAQGDYIDPQFAADAYVGRHYLIWPEHENWSFQSIVTAHPGDHWSARRDTVLGTLVRRDHAYVTTSGRLVHDQRILKSRATVRDLERLSRAARSLVVR